MDDQMICKLDTNSPDDIKKMEELLDKKYEEEIRKNNNGTSKTA